VFKRISSSFVRLAKLFKQSGQTSILFALLMPIFLLILGLVLDLGWYYLNVSRLQNAADAAAVAGAQKLLTDKDNFSDYKNVSLVGKYPGKVSNQFNTSNESALETITASQTTAKKYASKNLSGDENILVNSWTKNEIEHEAPILYVQENNLYFVVKLKENITHFFLPGWFNEMGAPVTSIAMVSKNASAVVAAEDEINPTSKLPDLPSTLDIPDMDLSIFPDMPTLKDLNIISDNDRKELESDRDRNVIIGNWEIQNYYRQAKNNTADSTGITPFYKIYGYSLYAERWNHFKDFFNHYKTGSFYRTQTLTIRDDVKDTNEDGKVDTYGTKSSVSATPAAISDNNPAVNEPRTYNPIFASNMKVGSNGWDSKINNYQLAGLPYTADKLDSINIDFSTEVYFDTTDKNNKWLKDTDWDLPLGVETGITKFGNTKGWKGENTSNTDMAIRNLRIHTSINFDDVYPVRSDQNSPDILWARIESEPMLYHPDTVNGVGGKVTISALNSVNQLIINANASNADSSCRPYVIFYDGPERYSTANNTRDSKPVILNLKQPFRAILYAPNSPVVIIGNAKEYFQGFVVAKKYMRLKDENDFVFDGYTNIPDLSIYSARTYYAKGDTAKKNPFYKITDENGIEMFIDARGDIQFADYSAAPKNYGSYNNFGRKNLTTHNYDVLQYSAENMLLSGVLFDYEK